MGDKTIDELFDDYKMARKITITKDQFVIKKPGIVIVNLIILLICLIFYLLYPVEQINYY